MRVVEVLQIGAANADSKDRCLATWSGIEKGQRDAKHAVENALPAQPKGHTQQQSVGIPNQTIH